MTLTYVRMMLIMAPTLEARALARQQVEVVNYPDGRFAVRHAGVDLPFRLFDKIGVVGTGAIVESKRLGEALAYGQARQAGGPGDPRRCGGRRAASRRHPRGPRDPPLTA